MMRILWGIQIEVLNLTDLTKYAESLMIACKTFLNELYILIIKTHSTLKILRFWKGSKLLTFYRRLIHAHVRCKNFMQELLFDILRTWQ